MTVLDLVVRRSTEVADGIRELELAAADGGALPAHPAGSHLVLECGGARNAYSLTNVGRDPLRYTIAVLRRPDGRGGSRYLHGLRPGDRVAASRPRSAFAPVTTARKHLLIAGGIGITPLLAHVRDAARWGREVELLYAHRPGAGAFVDELASRLGPRFGRTTDRVAFRAALAAALTTQPLGTHLYVCGPEPLTDRVLGDAARAGWVPQRLHRERFAAVEPPPGRPFVARLARSGRDVAVPSGTSLLDALRAAGVDVPNLCRQGLCGECRVPVLAGVPLHRDEYLTDDERAAGDAMLSCISRCDSDGLTLDL
ncbi:PDR/VanB family oxidoreductase [Cryptosporangium aurantiacum]|uniref:Ferredoxin-NADP reductase n=1 Tax=Cryptosporangium aurantiacum TaxID=134849 RepID=A0A1M7TWI8_9ACTN|nr:PDR/VanB family oxidoreductase [Cryptosporangium aurantiacum]SHN75066.1 Ferredoxin-NADP reductase [Cryptosporangium aurantiacum]